VAAGLEDLFRAHWPLVYGFLLRRTGNPSAAEELAQETFYRATRAFLGWRGGYALDPANAERLWELSESTIS
jgi:DNA-directed RNA polymerase specialized sigma24 family protein